jgi:hypothetical protein
MANEDNDFVSDNDVFDLLKKDNIKNKNIFVGALGDENLVREPFPKELDFFKENPHVGGMMTQEDFKVILNPYSKLTPEQKNSVMKNELARVIMKRTKVPEFEITPEQENYFSKINQGKPYGLPEDIRGTILGRIASDDKSAINPTQDQLRYGGYLKEVINNYLKKLNEI